MLRYTNALISLSIMLLTVSWSGVASAAEGNSALGSYEPYSEPPCPELEDRCNDYDYDQFGRPIDRPTDLTIADTPYLVPVVIDIADLLDPERPFMMPGVAKNHGMRSEFVTCLPMTPATESATNRIDMVDLDSVHTCIAQIGMMDAVATALEYVSPTAAAERISELVAKVIRSVQAEVRQPEPQQAIVADDDQYEEYVPYDLAEVEREFSADELLVEERSSTAGPRLTLQDVRQIPVLASFYWKKTVAMDIISDPNRWVGDRVYDVELALCGSPALESWRNFVDLAIVLAQPERVPDPPVVTSEVESPTDVADLNVHPREFVLVFAGILNEVGDQMKSFSDALVDLAGARNAEIARIPVLGTAIE